LDLQDKLLVERCLKNDKVAQEMLYKKYYGKMLPVCLRYVKDREEALEVLHDGFLKVFLNLNFFSGGHPLGAWIRKIMVHTAIDHFRKVQPKMTLLDISHAEPEADGIDIINSLSAEEIINAVQKLSPVYRIVFNLYAIEGFTHHEISEKLGISENTSKSNYAKARRNLRKIIESYHDKKNDLCALKTSIG
jgi:RNA polymerase sigma factor (sigma-70 family)